MALILRTVAPTMPVDPNQTRGFRFPNDRKLVELLIGKAAEILGRTPLATYTFPKPLLGDPPPLPHEIAEMIRPIAGTGLISTSFHAGVSEGVAAGVAAAADGNWGHAIDLYRTALEHTPVAERAIRGASSTTSRS